MANIVSSVTGGITGNNGGAGLGYVASSAPIMEAANRQQAQEQYQNVQTGLRQQQDFLNALQGQNALQNQSQVYNQLQGIANGTGANPAQAMLNQATGANVANQAALMAGQRGTSANPGMMARQIAQQGAATQQGAAGQAATMQANQSLNALNSMGSMANTQANQLANATNAYSSSAQGAQSNILGALGAQNQAVVGDSSSQNSANAGVSQQAAQQQGQFLGNMMNAAGSAMSMFSDERLKTDIKPGDHDIQQFLDAASRNHYAAGGMINPMQNADGGGGIDQVTPLEGAASELIQTPAPGVASPKSAIGQMFASQSSTAPGSQGSWGKGFGEGFGTMLGGTAPAAATQAPQQGKQGGDMMGSLMKLAPLALAAFSDEKVKTDIKPGGQEVQSFLDTVKPKEYEYKDQAMGKGKQVSPMAQDLEKTTIGKQMVQETPQGKMVDYAKGFGAILAAQGQLNARLKALEGDKAKFAQGGKVPAMVSPGEQYLPPKEAQAVAQGQKRPFEAGERIPGQPKVAGNSYANDTVPRTLQAGGVVIPNSIMQSKDAEAKAAEFVRRVLGNKLQAKK